jgi:chitinase
MRAINLVVAFVALLAGVGCSKEPGGNAPGPDGGASGADASSMRPPPGGGGSGGGTQPDSGPDRPPVVDAAPAVTPDTGPGPTDATGAGDTNPATDAVTNAPDAGAADTGGPDGAVRPLANRVVGYARSSLGNLPQLAATVDLRKLTHLIITFANPTATAPLALSSSDADVATIVSAGHAAGIKVLVAIGGASGTVRTLPFLAPDKLPAFVETVVAFADARGFDGVDVDVEDASISPASYEGLVMGLSAALKPRGKLVTAAVARWFDRQISAAALAQMDFVSVMAYDACNNNAPTPCPHSSYDTAVQELDHFVKVRSVPASKAVLGVPFYGYCWGTACPGPAPFYSEIVGRFPGAEAMDFLDMPDVKISYNGRATIERKAKLGRAHGGVMFWHLAADAPAPRSLLDVINGAL